MRGGNRTVIRGLALLVLLSTGSAAGAREQDAASPREEAHQALVVGLEQYAGWCQEERLFVERNRAYSLILEFEPDHSSARKALGFKKKGGVWSPPKRQKAAKNLDAEALKEAPERFSEAVLPFTEVMLELLEEEGLAAVELAGIEREILRVDPDNEPVRARRREVEQHGEWVLEETATARRRRVELKAIIHAAVRGAPHPTNDSLNERERDFGLNFQVASTRELRVLSTADTEETLDLARDIQAARDAFDKIMDLESLLPRGCTVFVMANDGEGAAFLDRHPEIDARKRSSLAKLEGTGIDGTSDWAFWTGARDKRTDGVLRIAIGYLLFRSFSITVEQGWAYEGFGLYMTRALVGTRLTWMLHTGNGIASRRALGIRNRLLDPTTNWIREAHGILGESPPDFEALFQKNASSLTAEDLLASYALAAYLIEGYPEETPKLLGRIGNGLPPRKAFDVTLGTDLSQLAARLERWIAENYAEEIRMPIAASKLGHDWKEYESDERAATIELFQEKLAQLDTSQLALVRELVSEEYVDVATIEERQRGIQYDPKKHAPQQPILRNWLDADDPRVGAVYEQFYGQRDPSALIAAYVYDWPTRKIVRTRAPDDIEAVFANAANGYPPGLDLALAVVERELDDGDLDRIQSAFGHVYTDLDGFVYPQTTLYDAWASGFEIAMPDVDALGVIHDLFDDWNTWQAPIPGREHEHLYATIGGEYRKIRRYRTLREALARLLLIGDPASSLYLPARTNLHAVWARSGSKVAKLKRQLPDQAEQEEWIAEWVANCKEDEKLWQAGQHRHTRLRADSEEVAKALGDAMQEVREARED
jgi:hypothetical protein